MPFSMNFNASQLYTIGVEIEFQLLDLNSYDLTPAAPTILEKIPAEFKGRIKAEFTQSMLEIASRVCKDINELEDDLRASIKILEVQARESGCRILATSLHPFGQYRDQVISDNERYQGLMAELQITGRRLITQSMHIHIGIDDPEAMIRVCDNLRVYLPILLALSTSSPFYQSEDTGFYSYRSRLLDSLPRSGMPQTMGSWKRFQALVAVMHKAEVLGDVRDIWWDVRPYPDLGTVEVRICDLPAKFSEILAITALVQALVITINETAPQELPPRPSMEMLLMNKWQAARHGLDGKFVYPTNAGNPTTMKSATNDLFEKVYPAARDRGTLPSLGTLKRLLQIGTAASRMRMMHGKNVDFETIINELQGDFWL